MKHISGAWLLVLLSSPLAADLPAAVDLLAKERLSMFDWGMYLLERELQQLTVHEREYINVRYDRGRGKFVIKGVFYLDPKERALVSLKRACFARVHAMKRALGVIDTDRIHIAPGADGRIGEKFSHSAVSDSDLDEADKLGAQLLKLFYVQAKLGADKDWFMFEHDVGCEGDLLSSEVRYTGMTAVR